MFDKGKKVRISLFSEKDIKNISNGEVKNSETLSYKDYKPVYNGLLCYKIFGYDKENTCLCNKRYNIFEDDIKICDSCGIRVSRNKERRNTFGHIKLNSNFINIIYHKTYPKFLSLILNLSILEIDNILYNKYYIVFYSKIKFLKKNDLINSERYFYYYKNYNDKFYAETGFKAIKLLIEYFDYNFELKKLKKYFLNNNCYNNSLFKKKINKYKIIKKFKISNLDLTDVFIKNLLVLPPDLRPVVKLGDNSVASSDLNVLYKKIIIRNERIKFFKKNKYSDFSLYNEIKITQESIDNLFINESCNDYSAKDNNNRILKSISSKLKGKSGLFRQNLLGKRVDFSGRSVIVSGANLNLDECAIPIDMAYELFRPFIYSEIISDENNIDINIAKIEVDKKTKLAFNILLKIVKDNYVLLNRAPTLHKLGMQSFKIILTKEKAIKLNPLVCAGFNADFDGDQMAVHIPLSYKSRIEYKRILISSNNILHPSNGDCIIAPTQDMVLGIYYFTIINYVKNSMLFNSIEEAINAYHFNLIEINWSIFLRIKNIFNGNVVYNIYETNLCRVLLYSILPPSINFSFINRNLKKSDITEILNFLYFNFGKDEVIKFSNNLMKLGFDFVTKSGLSLSIEDFWIDEKKYKIINDARRILKLYDIEYLNGFLSEINRKRKISSLWESVCEIISNISINYIMYNKDSILEKNKIFINKNPFYYIIESGARGSEVQLKQICGLRGKIYNKHSNPIEIPVLSNLREGLSVLEYFFFSHNSRKSLADTALKTSIAGYFTRRLVEISNDIIIDILDCKTSDGILFKNLISENVVIENFLERIIGRCICDDILDENGKVILKKNKLIDENDIFIIKNLKIDILKIRSPITCKSIKGVCSFCYGLNLSNNKIADLGDAVGVIAAQSIGEPGTQLTMRTFHSGGMINKISASNRIKSSYNGYLRYSNSLKYILKKKKFLVISKIGKAILFNDIGNELCSYNVPYGSILNFDNNSYIRENDILCEWDPNNEIILSDQDGYLKFENFFENINFIKRFDNKRRINFEILKFNYLNKSYIPYIKVCKDYDRCEKNYFEYKLKPGCFLYYDNKSYVKIGDILVKNFISSNNTMDITGGLPKVINLLEARVPKESSLISPVDGYINFTFTKTGKKYLNIYDNSNNLFLKKKILISHEILVNDNQIISKGDILINGTLNPHQYLDVYGKNEFINYMLSEIKSVYYSQGVKINDKHLEIILKQMLKKVLIIDSKTNDYITGDIVDEEEIIEYNKKIKTLEKIGKTIKYKNYLLGITKGSLTSKSFLSAASFQSTLSILSHSALISKCVKVNTLKEKIMTGKELEIGSGFYSKILLKRKNKKNGNFESID